MSLRLSLGVEMSLEVSVSWGVKLRTSLSKGVHLSLSIGIGMVMIVVLSGEMLNLVRELVQATQVETGAGDAQGCSREEGEERDAVDDLHGGYGDRCCLSIDSCVG
jgi:hypothetical protein